MVELQNTIEEKKTEIEEVKTSKDKEIEDVKRDKDRDLEVAMYEKAKQNYGLKKSNETLLDAITTLNEQVAILSIQPKDGSEATSEVLDLVRENE